MDLHVQIFSSQLFRMERGYHCHSRDNVNSISHWLHNVSLFDDAWRTVSVGAVQWLWSHQLCAFTVSVWTPFLALEAQRRNIPFPWAYMLLGQVVAISFAACLFFAVMAALPLRAAGNIQFNAPVTAFCSAIGIATVLISPYVATSSAFMPNLLAMHAVLVVPLVLPERLLRPYTSRQPLALAAIYLFAAGANFANFLQQVIALLATSESKNLIQLMVKVLYSHPAQSSIGWDIICVSLFGATWMIADSRSLDRPKSAAHLGVSQKIAYMLFICTPFLSISTTLPLYLAWREIM
ncbi:unnamed protein product [Umbelopsis ramanniana]